MNTIEKFSLTRARQLADLLPQEAVDLTLTHITEKDSIICYLSGLLYKAGKLRSIEEFVTAVNLREKLGPTYISDTLAFPHAKSDSVKRMGIAVGRSNHGIPYDTPTESLNIKTIFLFAFPEQVKADKAELGLVKDIASLFLRVEFRASLLEVESYEDLNALILKCITE